MVKAIFFDIDGTLLSTETHIIPSSAYHAIEELRAKGIMVFIATGRSMCELKNINLPKFDGYITMSGQHCSTTDGTVIYEQTICREDITTIIDYVTKHNIPANFTDGNEKYCNIINDEVLGYLTEVNIAVGDIRDITYALSHKVHQISVVANEEVEKQLMAILPNCTSARWHPAFFDIFPLNGHKLNGINHICQHYNINLADTMAFGDSGNDIEMLVGTGLSVALGNGSNEVKSVASHVTDTVDNDGVYKALKHLQII